MDSAPNGYHADQCFASPQWSPGLGHTSSPHRKRTKRVSPAPEDKYCNYTRWMAVETASLMRLVRQQDQDNIQWDQIAEDLGTERSPSQCQNKWNAEIAKLDPNKDDEEKFIKGRWSPQEDQALQHGVERYLRSNGMMPQPPAFLPDEENEARPVETGAPVTRDQDETSELFNSLVDNHLYDDSGPDVSSAADLTHSKVLHQLQLFSSMSSASSSCSPYHSSPSSPSSYTTSSSTPPRPFRNTSGVRSSPPVFRTRQDYENEVSRLMVRCPWGLIVKSIDGRSGIQAQARWSEALDPQVRRGKWSLREDRLLFEGVEKHARCWIRIADGIPGRTQRQCRTRWVQLRTKGEREQAEAMALALRKEQEKMMKEKKNEEEEEEEEEVTREYQRDVINDDLKKVVKLLRFAAIQEHQIRMPLDFFMELGATEFYAPNVPECIDILREERRRLFDAQLKLTELIALSSRPASNLGQTSQLTAPSTSASVPQQQQEPPRTHSENAIKERLHGIGDSIRVFRISLDSIATLSASAPVDMRKLEKDARYAYHPDRETCWRNLWEEQNRLTKRRDALDLEFEKQRTAAMGK
ncbi:hypothetical protein CPC16_008062 [Podila verticillata]|nr:hypothetical protein CPC16_008062 [Podila verticillata]